MTDKPKDPIEFALKRLSAAFLPPEVSDVGQFQAEFRTALRDLSPEALIEGVTDIVRTRKHKSFPSIGEIRQSCLQSEPSSPRYSSSMPSSRVEDEAEKRLSALAMLAHHPQIERLIEAGMHNRMLEFILETGRFPAGEEWFEVKKDHAKVQAHIAEATGPAPHYFITRMAEAILYRRERLAVDIMEMRKEAAE